MSVSDSAPRLRGWLLLAVVGCLALTGCYTERPDTSYGRRSGESIAGTGVLAEMFIQSGHRVSSWRYLSPRLYEADTIVWAPDKFTPPDEGTIAWLNEWLEYSPGGTLIYIGRDYDPEISYWRHVLPGAPQTQANEIQSRLSQAENFLQKERQRFDFSLECDWFTLDASRPSRKVQSLSGPWSQGIDARRVEIELNSRTIPSGEYETLLANNDAILVSRHGSQWGTTGQLIVVNNGSFLLNFPLINHEHRKLAGKLVAATGQAGDVVFLESGVTDPPIQDEDPSNDVPTGIEIFFVWPLNFILLHLALLGLIFAFARAPIFGLPRSLPAPPLSDFSRHVTALGELLQKTKDRGYAAAQLDQYYQRVRSEGRSKKSAASSPPPAEGAQNSNHQT